jgi:hypothetical protein
MPRIVPSGSSPCPAQAQRTASSAGAGSRRVLILSLERDRTDAAVWLWTKTEKEIVMDQVMNRRAMVGSVLAAGAAGAVGWLGGLEPLQAAAAAAAPASTPDDLTLVIGEEIRQSVREMTRRPGPGARRFAGALKVYAAHGRARRTDQAMANYYRQLVATEGRDAVLATDPDWRLLQAEARNLGIDRVTPTPMDMASRGRALDAMLSGKFTMFLDRVATEVDGKSHRMDERNVPGVRPIVYRDAGCIASMEMENWASWAIRLSCATSFMIWGDVPVCAVAVGVWAGVWLANEGDGCHG